MKKKISNEFKIFLLFYIIVDVLTTPLSLEYRDFSFMKIQDYSSFQVQSQINTTTNYTRTCESPIFGYFSQGVMIRKTIQKNKFGTLGLNFGLLIKISSLIYDDHDSLTIRIAQIVVKNILISAAKEGVIIKICNNFHVLTKINIVLPNTYLQFNSTVDFSMIADFNANSKIEWAIYDFQMFIVNCPVKCPNCSSYDCHICDSNNTSFNNTCKCDSSRNQFDYSNYDEPLNCQDKYQPILREDFNKQFVNTKWIYNGNEITPFNLNYNCTNSNQNLLGGYNLGQMDSLSKIIYLNKLFGGKLAYSKYQMSFKLNFLALDNGIRPINIVNVNSGRYSLSLSSQGNATACNDGVVNYQSNQSITDLYDNPMFINITFYIPKYATNTNNNFALSNFNLDISPCFKQCSSCITPQYDGCLTCKDENSVITNGQCLCKEGYILDIFDKNFACASKNNFLIFSF